MDRDLAGELLELVAARHEVRLALDLDEHPHLARGVEVGRHDALAGGPPAPLRGGGLSLDPEDLPRAIDVPLRLGQSGLAIHDPCARALAERLHIARLDILLVAHVTDSWPVSAGAASAAGAPLGPPSALLFVRPP